MNCTVCARPGASPRLTAGGDTYGTTCAGRCDALAWEMWWLRRVSATAYELALCAWEWRRHVAQVRGFILTEAPPASPSETRVDGWIHGAGLESVARELA